MLHANPLTASTAAPQRPWRHRALALWLALLVVLAPTLGRMHGVLHLPPLVAAAFSTSVHGSDAPAAAPGGIAALFQHHAVLDCWQFEQLGHGHDQPSFAWAGPAPAPSVSPAWQPHAQPQAAPLRPFQARAPPACCMA